MSLIRLFVPVMVMCGIISGLSLAAPAHRDHIEVELISELSEVVPGEPFWVGLRLLPDKHWHTYWRNPGDSGLETRIEWQLPAGSEVGEIQWPYPEQVDMAGIINYGYEGEVILLSQVTPPAELSNSSTQTHFEIHANASWLVCKDVCIPGDAELTLSLPYGKQSRVDYHWQASIKTTLQHWPVELKAYQSVYELEGDHVNLELSSSELALHENIKVQYFPITGDILQYSAAQSTAWDLQTTSIAIRQQKSTYLTTLPDEVEGVVVLEMPQGKTAYQFIAQQGQLNAALSAKLNVFEQTPDVETSFGLILIFAFLGGLILNLMPCVFPVLSLKALSLLNHREESQSQQRLHGMAYTFGVVISFVVIAVILLLLRSAGDRIGWGFQLQLPWFIALLSFVFFVLALSLSGFMTLGSAWLGVGQSLTQRKGCQGSFFTGLLAALVATPCTAPFMGPAMGYAITQTTATALSVFACLGFGMAMPFLLLSFMPRLASYLPKPGKWMETFKEAMAFPLYLTVVYLLWVLGRQTDMNTVALVLSGLVVLAFMAWLGHSFDSGGPKRWLLKALIWLSGISVLAILLLLTDLNRQHEKGDKLNPQSFSMQRLEALRQENKTVFVNLTADWCITCKVNERVALSTDEVAEAFKRYEVEYLVGDWTLRDAEITKMLERFNRTGVPLYLLYTPENKQAKILPQILTPSMVVDALEE